MSGNIVFRNVHLEKVKYNKGSFLHFLVIGGINYYNPYTAKGQVPLLRSIEPFYVKINEEIYNALVKRLDESSFSYARYVIKGNLELVLEEK